jgi:acetylornithine deacetylase/succinyl-diaminopimelate desuccinylase-like protein
MARDSDPHGLHAAIKARRGAILDLTRRLVAIPSDLPSHDERAVVAALATEAATLGLPPGTIHAASPERPNLLFRLRGRQAGPAILLNGHVDTKPPGELDLWPADPWDPWLADGAVHGLGTADMKGALAAMLHAASVLREAGLPRRGELMLALTADEEADGVLGLGHLVPAAGLRPDVALIGEPSGLRRSFDTLPLGSRGFVGFRLTARGPRIHSALADQVERPTAIDTLVRVLDRLAQVIDFGGPVPGPFAAGPTLSPATALAAGVAPGIVPDVAVATGDVRTVPGQSREAVAEALRGAIDLIGSQVGADLAVEVELDAQDWPATLVDADLPLVRSLTRATAAVVGAEPAAGVFPGATEAHVLDRLGIPCVPAFGPGLLRNAHVPGESVLVDDLEAAAAIYALTIADLLG